MWWPHGAHPQQLLLLHAPPATQAAGSFIGRQASSGLAVRAASNYGASRSFVFGSDPSNAGASNPGSQQHDAEAGGGGGSGPDGSGGAAGPGPSSFAGLSRLIPEAAPAAGGSRLGGGGGGVAAGKRGGGLQAAKGGGAGSLLGLLHGKQASSGDGGGGAWQANLKQHADAVGTKFKAAADSTGGSSSGGPPRPVWEF